MEAATQEFSDEDLLDFELGRLQDIRDEGIVKSDGTTLKPLSPTVGKAALKTISKFFSE